MPPFCQARLAARSAPSSTQGDPFAFVARPGDTCWRREHADRVAFLLDGADYYAALRAALIRAERTIYIVGWELHSQVQLVPGDPGDGWPARLNDLLREIVRRRKRVQIHILLWDFAVVYAVNREATPVFSLPWKSARRLVLRMDGQHPLGGSHHQKVVVIDDRVAFNGGMDIAAGRWDTSEHCATNPLRCTPDGELYGPTHDVQMMVSGPAAATLGDLVRDRWQAATGRTLPRPAGGGDPWPDHVQPDARRVGVAIARTRPAHQGRREVREVERLYIAAIAAAREVVYIENQYFTAARIGDALEASLLRPDGPEIVVITSPTSGGWLEEVAVGVGRARLVRRLRRADRHGRLSIYTPSVEGMPAGHRFVLHAKLMVVDDTLLRIGSANLANRSMGLDSECDLAIEADGRPDTAAAIIGLRDRLLAEHLGCSPAEIAAEIARRGSVAAAIEARRGAPRTLEPLPQDPPDLLDHLAPDALLDPERPIELEELAGRLLRIDDGPAGLSPGTATDGRGRAHWRALLAFGTILLAVTALAAAWKLTPLAELADVDRVLAWARGWNESWAAPLLVLAAYLCGGFVMFPVTVLIWLSGVLFGPVMGAVYALLGSIASACVTFAIGAALGRDAVRRVAGRYANRVSRALGKRGVLTAALVRMVPLAPFTVVNLVAGASHIRFRDFVIGSVLGMTPGILAVVMFGDRLALALRDPSPTTIVALLAALVVVVGLFHLSRLWISRRDRATRWLQARAS